MKKFRVILLLAGEGYRFSLQDSFGERYFPSYASAEKFINDELPDFKSSEIDCVLIQEVLD